MGDEQAHCSYGFSIKEVAEFCWREGDVQFNESAPGSRTATAKQGQQAHQKLQNQNKQDCENYQAEVSVSYQTLMEHVAGNYQLTLRGRADAIWQRNQQLWVEEIKSTYATPDTLPTSQHQLHLAQAKLYAFLLNQQQAPLTDLPPQQDVQVQITYWQLESEQQFEKLYTFTLPQLENFFQQTLEKFNRWLKLFHTHRQARQQFIGDLPFPFQEYRRGQKEFAASCYRACRDRDTALIHAATGIGKSIASLFGSIKALADTSIQQIWYLTAKTSGKQAVDQAVQLFHQQGAPIKVLHLYNQARSCFCEADVSTEAASTPLNCQWQQGFYDRKQLALEALFQQSLINLESLRDIAQDYQLCPYQLAQELIPWVDVVIADFNYVFSHTVRNQGYLENKGKQIALLVDESHNLANRCRDLYQSQLTQEQLHSAMAYASSTRSSIAKTIKGLTNQIRKLPHDSTEYPEKLFQQIGQLKTELDEDTQLNSLLFTPEDLILFKAYLNQWLRLEKYCQQGLGSHQGKAFSLLRNGNDLKLVCNNPGPVIQDLTQCFNSTTYFSGSLLPLEFFSQQFSDQGIKTRLAFASPFPCQRLQIILGPLAMDYKNRQDAIPNALNYITTLYKQMPGLYLVCVPSYQFLQQIEQAQRESRDHPFGDIPMVLQKRDLAAEESLSLETRLKLLRKGIAFVIMGGSFAEGVEWPKGVLKGVIILGNGMPGPTATQQRLKVYFDNTAAQGFDFAYRFPAINRVIQTAGRIQRSEKDAGIVLLLDRRFRQSSYQQLLPDSWQYKRCNSSTELQRQSEQFWTDIEKRDND